MDWKGAPQTPNIVDLRQPSDAVRMRKPTQPNMPVAPIKEYKSITEFLKSKSAENVITDDAQNWEQNPAYTRWLQKKDAFEADSRATTAKNFHDQMAQTPDDPEITLYELRTISIGDRLKNLQSIMRPYNGR